jgi:hypothetical protein
MAYKYKSAISIALVILLGIALQVVFVFAETKETPNKVAVEFAEAYFKFDPAMKYMLCSKLSDDQEQDYVAIYIHESSMRARDLGYNLSYMKTGLKDIITNTLARDETTATIELKAKSKYALRTFFTGDRFEVYHKFDMIKEDGKWKVCGNPFFIAGTGNVKEMEDVEKPALIKDLKDEEDSDDMEKNDDDEKDSEDSDDMEKSGNV